MNICTEHAHVRAHHVGGHLETRITGMRESNTVYYTSRTRTHLNSRNLNITWANFALTWLLFTNEVHAEELRNIAHENLDTSSEPFH